MIRLPPDTQRESIVFLHGFLGSGSEWGEITASLGGAFSCLCPDLPGHGGAAMADCSDAAAVSEWLLHYLDDAGVKTCALAGYSMGGRLALYLALRHPARFHAVILESASPGVRDDAARAQRRAADERLAARLEAVAGDAQAFRAFLEEWHAQPFFAGMARNQARLDALMMRRMRQDSRRLAAVLRGLGQGVMPDLWDALAKYRIPTLLIAGERDPKYAGIAAMMSDACPSITVRIMPDCGHNVHFENPGGYTNAVKDFLTALR